MRKDYLLQNETAVRLYDAVKELPIVDYHCHLSPKEIYEDEPFSHIGDVWLGGDHYKWRLMRTAGVDERFITGDATADEKFEHYAAAIEFAAGNPLFEWSEMELSLFFGIDEPLSAASARRVMENANRTIRKERLSPRKLIERSRVETICTTDDPTDDLHYHALLRDDPTMTARVLPSFRTDNLLLCRKAGYRDYLGRLGDAAGLAVTDLASLKEAVRRRLAFFVENGCRYTDVGIPLFPSSIADEESAAATFAALLQGEEITAEAENAFVGHMFVFLAGLYREYDLVMQLHMAVIRNANGVTAAALGADCGVDCVGDPVKGADLVRFLDAVERSGGLPETILYTLNPTNADEIASIAGAFRRVRCGAAWWFCDHKRGIEQELSIIAENSALGNFLGMLTDSRSFLSYARHDYFRRILCSFVGERVEKGLYPAASAETLVRRVCYQNVKQLTEKGGKA